MICQLVDLSTFLEFVMDDSTKGWIVSLDYGMTAVIALASGQLQVLDFGMTAVIALVSGQLQVLYYGMTAVIALA